MREIEWERVRCERDGGERDKVLQERERDERERVGYEVTWHFHIMR